MLFRTTTAVLLYPLSEWLCKPRKLRVQQLQTADILQHPNGPVLPPTKGPAYKDCRVASLEGGGAL